MSQHEPQVIHSIDGIEEYNNPLPAWWLTLFYGCIIFALIYMVLYPSWFGAGLLKWSQVSMHEAEVKAYADKAPKSGIATMLSDPAAIEAGKAVYAANCVACHGVNLEGTIGPNLKNPPYWAYGTGTPEDMVYIVTHGTTGTAGLNKEAKGGMPTWKALGAAKIDQVVAYIVSESQAAPAATTEAASGTAATK